VSDAAPLLAELAPALDPFDCCARLAGLPYVVFLDSASDPDHLGRHSFITADPFTAVRAKGLLTQQLVDGDWIRIDADPLAHVRALLAPHGRPAVVDLNKFGSYMGVPDAHRRLAEHLFQAVRYPVAAPAANGTAAWRKTWMPAVRSI